ncbi:MAG: prolipoprotein diacylglyceryl transferase [Clostridia bacterium]|nr:prolipoprotein diacylglyceryl transferase [Clostridia bacterium]
MYADSLSFSLGSAQVFYYGLFTAIGLVAFVLSNFLLRNRRHISFDTALIFSVIALPAALVCSRILFCALDFNFHSVFSPKAVTIFWGGGFSMVGALLGFALAAFITGRITKVCPLKILDGAFIGILLFMTFARMGEPYTELMGRSRSLISDAFKSSFLAIGDEYDAYLRTYALESAAYLIIAAFMLIFRKKERKTGDLMLMGMLLLGCAETLFYSLRFDSHMRRSFISVQQLLFAVIMALPLILFSLRCGKKQLWISVGILAFAVVAAVVLEFMIDRSGISRILLYAVYIAVLALPAAAGCIFYKRSNV